jgi:hypothetical protein
MAVSDTQRAHKQRLGGNHGWAGPQSALTPSGIKPAHPRLSATPLPRARLERPAARWAVPVLLKSS